jgi:hypothetical protein
VEAVSAFLRHINLIIVIVVALLVGAACFFPQLGAGWFSRFEGFARRFARRKGAVVVSIALATVLMRVALLPVMPVPLPCHHDEFSYLLAGDTFAHGRLANPPTPVWLFLDTFRVLQQPTYASMYPPAQGAFVALGEILGNPWIGVLLSAAAMGAAVTWAMQGWLPARWALLGGILLLLRIGLFSYWMNSYWGGSVSATGGALVVGSLPRIIKHLRVGDAALMALGAALMANSRPFEGVIFCLPVAAALVAWLLSKQGPAMVLALRRLILPLAVLFGATLAFTTYYNWRVTGNALLLPEALELRGENFPMFLGQAQKPPLHYSNPQFEYLYNTYMPTAYPRTAMRSLVWKANIFWMFFLGSALTVPVVAFPWVLRDQRTRFLLVQCLVSALALLAVRPFFPHYAAPLTATVFILLIQAMRHLSLWKIGQKPVGLVLCRLVVLLTVARLPYAVADQARNPGCPWSFERARITRQLDAVPGKQLVLVRYSPQHNAAIEWVYNPADVDGAKIVWAREIPGVSIEPLLEHYEERKVWLLEADVFPVALRSYEGDRTNK